MTAKTHRELKIWQDSRILVKAIYIFTRHKLPPEEKYELGRQMRRAAVSVPSNIAEGYARETTKDYLYFLVMARGSLAELETQLLLCCDLDYATEEEVHLILEQITSIQRMINATRATLKRKLADA